MAWYKITFSGDQMQNGEEHRFLMRFLDRQRQTDCPKHLVLFRPIELYATGDTVIYLPPNAYPYLEELLSVAEECDMPAKDSVSSDAGSKVDFDFWFA